MDQPLMRNVLADLCLESEEAAALALRLALGFDESPHDEGQSRFTRLATAVGKYWITKRAVAVVAEALECLGGNGYVEESPLPRLYRDAPLNSIWKGSGNVQCLEMLRAVKKDAGTLGMVLQEIRGERREHTSTASLIDLSANWPTRLNSKRVRAALPNF